MARAAASAGASRAGSSREGTPDSRALGQRALVPGGGVGTKGRSRDVRSLHPGLESCRSVYEYEVSHDGRGLGWEGRGRPGSADGMLMVNSQRLNSIEEGSYGIVFRARCKKTGAIVALKKFKMDKEKNGFPITSLREIQTLMTASHDNIVRVREIVVGDTLTQ